MTNSIIFIFCFLIFIVATETVKGCRLSNLQKISFSCIPLSIFSYDILSNKFGGILIPLLAISFWLGLGAAILLLSDYLRHLQKQEKKQKRP